MAARTNSVFRKKSLLKGVWRYLLANAGIAGQDVGILQDGEVRGGVVGDLQHTAPFGEVGTVLLVLSATLGEAVKTCGDKTM